MKCLLELESLIVEWAEARKIIPNAKPEVQLMKTWSEVGELADAIIKSDFDEIKDAIGDIFVTLVIWNHLKFGFPVEEYTELIIPITEQLEFFNEMNSEIVNLFETSATGWRGYRGADCMFNIFDMLASIAEFNSFTFEECVESAYNTIKDRKGTLLENGVFVKEE